MLSNKLAGRSQGSGCNQPWIDLQGIGSTNIIIPFHCNVDNLTEWRTVNQVLQVVKIISDFYVNELIIISVL